MIQVSLLTQSRRCWNMDQMISGVTKSLITSSWEDLKSQKMYARQSDKDLFLPGFQNTGVTRFSVGGNACWMRLRGRVKPSRHLKFRNQPHTFAIVSFMTFGVFSVSVVTCPADMACHLMLVVDQSTSFHLLNFICFVQLAGMKWRWRCQVTYCETREKGKRKERVESHNKFDRKQRNYHENDFSEDERLHSHLSTCGIGQ
jgi:hypothetical protein